MCFGKIVKSWSCMRLISTWMWVWWVPNSECWHLLVPKSDTEGRIMRLCGLSNKAENSFWLFLWPADYPPCWLLGKITVLYTLLLKATLILFSYWILLSFIFHFKLHPHKPKFASMLNTYLSHERNDRHETCKTQHKTGITFLNFKLCQWTSFHHHSPS